MALTGGNGRGRVGSLALAHAPLVGGRAGGEEQQDEAGLGGGEKNEDGDLDLLEDLARRRRWSKATAVYRTKNSNLGRRCLPSRQQHGGARRWRGAAGGS
jgi:hypothetical protein